MQEVPFSAIINRFSMLFSEGPLPHIALVGQIVVSDERLKNACSILARFINEHLFDVHFAHTSMSLIFIFILSLLKYHVLLIYAQNQELFVPRFCELPFETS